MDNNIIRMVVGFLGTIGVLCVGGMVYLASHKIEPPSSLVSTAAGTVGALAGILAAQKER